MTVRFAIAVFLFFCCPAFGQTVLKGRLLKTPGNAPIPYANIGILNSPIGTISNADGTFELRIDEKYLNEAVIFSALGFERRSFPARTFEHQKDFVIHLNEQPTILEDVVVTSNKTGGKIMAELGNRYFNAGSIYADSVAAGSAMALLIENKYPAYHPELSPPYYVGEVKLRIAKNTFDNFKLRIRFFDVDSATGLPGKDLLNESVVITSAINKGWLDVDLAPYHLKIHAKAFFVAFEWILDDEARLTLLEQYKEFKRQYPEKVSIDTMRIDGQKIPYHSWHGFMAGTSLGSSSNKFSIDNYKSFYRNHSYGEWKRASFVLTARVTVSNQPFEVRKRKAKTTVASE